MSTAALDHGEYSWGKWRRCPTCKRRVWLTKAGKLCRHIDEGHDGPDGPDPFAVLSNGFAQGVPRCRGDKP